MANRLSVSEFTSVAKTDYQSRIVDCLGSATLKTDMAIPTSGTTPTSITVRSDTNYVRLFADTDCQISINNGAFERYPAGSVEVRQIPANMTVQVLQA